MTTFRNIVIIDEEKCNGCGLCVSACAEGAIQLIQGKARLVSETYCDGLGACLGHCPQDAIRVEKRQVQPFDEKATNEHLEKLKEKDLAEPKPSADLPHNPHSDNLPCGCAGTLSQSLQPQGTPAGCPSSNAAPAGKIESQLGNWPVQLKLVSPAAPYFHHQDLLVVADCVPFAFADFHRKFLTGKPTVVACPKLDNAAQDYIRKLAETIQQSAIKSITVLHMEVPCCTGLVRIVQEARELAQSNIPIHKVNIGIKGNIISQQEI